MIDHFIEIQEASKVPKYQQIVNSVRAAAAKGALKPGTKLPSVNELVIEFDISRDTVVRAYDQLKESGVIESVPGKGYYLRPVEFAIKAKVFLLFNKLSAHKKIIYDAFSKKLGDKATIDFFIYDNNYRQFKQLIGSTAARDYTHYVLICHFEEGGDDVCNFLNASIPGDKLIVLDKALPDTCAQASSVYQDFELDIYRALLALNSQLKKYHTLKLVIQKPSYHPKEIQQGFIRFCAEFAYKYELVKTLENEELAEGNAYINLREDDLVLLIKKIKQSGLLPGKNIGLISYNDTPIKEVLLEGITVISTDFENLGREAAACVLSNEDRKTANPFYVIPRNSL